MPDRVCIDGEVLDPAEARIPVLDRGFLYGDGVFETLRTYGGVPFAEREHLRRLADSAARVGIDLPVGLDALAAELRRTLEAAGHPESYVRIMITRGSGPLSFDPATASGPRRLIFALPLRPPGPQLYERGVQVRLMTVPGSAVQTSRGAKTTSFQPHVLAAHEARRQGAHEALLVAPDGQVLEGSTSNVFVVRKDRLRTPSTRAGVLEGVTRAAVLGLAAVERVPAERTALFARDLYTADEVFLTSTLREVLPVVRVDDRPVLDGRPGPLTRRLHALYRTLTGPSRA